MQRDGGARQRILDYFLAHLGEIVTKEELQSVARISEWPRRVRELRDEMGYQILSHNSILSLELQQHLDIRKLKPGDYILVSPDRVEAIIRDIGKDVRQAVLQKYGSTCQFCGRGPNDIDPYNPGKRVVLNIDHIKSLKEGGTNEFDNLMPVCSVCNEGKKERSFTRREVLDLMQDINTQPPNVQREIYMKLKERWSQD